eukprot:2583494-Pleurochrysis_carterae.AAC.5
MIGRRRSAARTRQFGPPLLGAAATAPMSTPLFAPLHSMPSEDHADGPLVLVHKASFLSQNMELAPMPDSEVAVSTRRQMH